MAEVYAPPADTYALEPLERRVLMNGAGPDAANVPTPAPSAELSAPARRATPHAAPAAPLSANDRLALLNNLSLPAPLTASLRAQLKAGDTPAFDAALLAHMTARAGSAPTYFFRPGDLGGVVNFVNADTASRANLAASIRQGILPAADNTLAHKFKVQGNSAAGTVQLPAAIDWDAMPADLTSAPDFLHALNTHAFWEDLALAYRFTGDRKYATELAAQLKSWHAENPPLAKADDWIAANPRWWLLDSARRVDHWTRSYHLLLGTKGLSAEAHTLFLSGLLRHGQFLSAVTPLRNTINWTAYHGSALAQLGTVFPEFTGAAAWKAKGQGLLIACLERQFRPDGGHAEQSPSYTSTVLHLALQAVWLSKINDGSLFTRKVRVRLTAMVEALYQLTLPDNKLPALSDTYSAIPPLVMFNQAAHVLGDDRYRLTTPSLEDVLLFGTAAVSGHLNDARTRGFFDRGPAYALRDSGYYVLRAKETTVTDPSTGQPRAFARTQLVFDAGAKGGSHGHNDLLSFELGTSAGKLIVDPGPGQYGQSAERLRVTSTPAHNTISIDGKSHEALDSSTNTTIVTEHFEVTADHAIIVAHHHAYQPTVVGRPVVARGLWLDRSDPDFSWMVVVDWASTSGKANHVFTTSMNFPVAMAKVKAPGADGVFKVPTTPYPLRVQPIPMTGQKAAVGATRVYPTPPPDPGQEAVRYAITQTARSALFVTLVARDLGDANTVTATLAEALRAGRSVKVLIRQAGRPDKIIALPAPDLAPLENLGVAYNGGYIDPALATAPKVLPMQSLARPLSLFSTENVEEDDLLS